MTTPGYIAALAPLVRVFEQYGIGYHIGGSVASTAYGLSRTTLDVDIIADLRPEHAHMLFEHLQKDYYIDEDMIADAIRDHSSFNLIHLESMFKLDVFVLKASDYDRQAFLRADLHPLDDRPDSPLYFVESAEDVVLNKLRLYHRGGELSDRQWSDVLGVLRVQGDALEMAYLRHWAIELGVADLLTRALLGTQGRP